MLLGEAGFKQLSDSHVAIVGLGAVGGYAVEGLARAGLGRLTLVDFDIVQPTNINRQIVALESTMGRPKASLARERVIDINPACRVDALQLFVDNESVAEVINRSPDVIVDAIDSLNPKVQLLTACHQSTIPTFSSMGAALRSDAQAIRVGDLSESNHCPLAKRVRKRLRRENIESGITCVYSVEPVRFDYTQKVDEKLVETGSDRGRERNVLGSLPTITAIFGLILANEVIKTICREP
jgi:tRNA threonylcarbamoyladenosine dehydratase